MKTRFFLLTCCLLLCSLTSFAQEVPVQEEDSPPPQRHELGLGIPTFLSFSQTGLLYRYHTKKGSYRLRLNPNFQASLFPEEGQGFSAGGAAVFLGYQWNKPLGDKFSLYYGIDLFCSLTLSSQRSSVSNLTPPTTTRAEQSGKGTSLSVGPHALAGINWRFHSRLSVSLEAQIGPQVQYFRNNTQTQTTIVDNNGVIIADFQDQIINNDAFLRFRMVSPAIFISYFF